MMKSLYTSFRKEVADGIDR